ncbi:Sodium-coupled monocarboxylate transporter 2-like 6 [Homarus americanus]|uniref:Sodium-coupled monocarboxylate transporter 2-like 6 n=1 Tax=Homarus americanus TaxID=6706 RepID=A0A8J5JBI3_HOMAM|nr:Sodium-coupled monocarboxylate transporter 2-like 6 [Homarus americanus]
MSTTDEATTIGPRVEMESKFTAVDYTIFGLMLAVSIGIGIYCAVKSRGKESTQEYMLGGRNMSPLPVAMSLLGGVISSISILDNITEVIFCDDVHRRLPKCNAITSSGNSTEMYFFGTQLATSLLGFIPGTIFLNQVMLPVLYNLKIVSLNEYLEIRFKSRVLRTVGTVCQMVVKTSLMGMVLYAPSLALSTVTNLSTLSSMIIMGAICTFYITIGGVKAVVYTDVMQTLVMFLGVLVVVIICCVDLGGLGNMWRIANEGNRIEFFNLDSSPFVRHTFWSTFVLGFFVMIGSIGLNQAVYQRFASVSSLRIAKRLSIFFLVGVYCLWTLFFLSGLVAFATYSTCDPLTSGKITKPDQILPFLVTDKLSHLTGLAGVFVSAVYGGVLSSLSSTGNSLACMIWEDFLKHRPYFSGLSSKSATNVVKIISSFTGVLAVIFGLLVGSLGNVFHVIFSITSSVIGPLAGLYVTGMCLPWVTAKGGIVGITVSMTYGLWIVVGKFIRGGGSPPRLPLSTSGCPEALFNASVNAFLNITTVGDSHLPTSTLSDGLLPITTLANTTGLEGKSKEDHLPSFESTIMSVSEVWRHWLVHTGPNHPKELVSGTINPTCEKLYVKLWKSFGGQGEASSTRHRELQVEESSMKMLNSDSPPLIPLTTP